MRRDFSLCSDIVQDTGGTYISPSSMPAEHTYDALGRRLTTTITDGTDSWVYTRVYDAAGNNTTESGWVKQ